MSPLKMRKLPHSSKYRVYDGKKIIAKRTSLENAESQIRLIHAIKHGGIKRRSK